MTKATNIEARVAHLGARLRIASAARLPESKAVSVARADLALMGHTLRQAEVNVAESRGVTERLAALDFHRWAKETQAAAAGSLSVRAKADPKMARELLAPLEREAGVELVALIRLADSLVCALNEATVALLNESNPHAVAVLHFTKSLRHLGDGMTRCD